MQATYFLARTRAQASLPEIIEIIDLVQAKNYHLTLDWPKTEY